MAANQLHGRVLEKLIVAQIVKRFPQLLYSPKVHYHAHRIPSLSQLSLLHTLIPDTV
jgi:hypothetical protein